MWLTRHRQVSVCTDLVVGAIMSLSRRIDDSESLRRRGTRNGREIGGWASVPFILIMPAATQLHRRA